MEMDMELTYLGTNALFFNKADTHILVDPHFTRPGLPRLLGKIDPDTKIITAGLTELAIKHLDGVLLTHTHYDHALDAVQVLSLTGGKLYGSKSAVNLGIGGGLGQAQCEQVTPNQVNTIGAFQVIFHPAQHISFTAPLGWLMPKKRQINQPLKTPTWFWNYPSGAVHAIQIDRILIFGSAGFNPGAYRDLGIDAVVLGVGGLDFKPDSYLQQLYQEAVLLSGAKVVYISHWDNFFKPVERGLHPLFFSRRSIKRVTELGKHHGQHVKLLEYGTTITV